MPGDLLFSQEGSWGLITLNRPKALHALTLEMIFALYSQLRQWQEDASVQAVMIKASPSPAFCAGGDVRWLYTVGKEGDPQQNQFFWQEYRLNHLIHHLGKPYVALMDGITMGGGVGVSLHGSHPLATERFVFAMPETGIGFFPDIGASYLLNRCPGAVGMYLGLTGNRLNAEEALLVGLVKQVLSSEQIPALTEALLAKPLGGDAYAAIDACLATFQQASSEVSLLQGSIIDSCFSKPSIEAIMQTLENNADSWSMNLSKSLSTKSPLSLKVTLAQLNKAKGLSQAQCLQMDYNLVGHFMRGYDFYEGVRALLIDKDKNPHWSPATLEKVTEVMVVDYFEQQKGLIF